MNAIPNHHGASGNIFRSLNPTTGQLEATFPTLDEPQLENVLQAASAAQRRWAASTVATRAAVLRAISAGLRAARDELGRLATIEMGKPLAGAMVEADKSAATCDWYAEHGAEILATTEVAMPTGSAQVVTLPIGVVLAIMPWNFPIWQAMRFIAPALMAGNGILLKHAANVPQCARTIERVVREAAVPLGMPENLFTTIFVDTPGIPAIIADDRVAAVTLTGSERAGMSVGEHAGRALKKCVLELGGSDPFIVMPSADLPAAVTAGITARMQNNGQSCICAKRFIIHDALYAGFETAYVAAARALAIGDPLEPGTDIGPLSTAAARDHLHDQVRRAVAAGGRILTGGQPLDGEGFFYPPTVIAGLSADSAIAREEFFGPVALLFAVPDADAALRLANAVPFGLGSSVWTRDDAEAEFFVMGIEAGMTAINTLVISDPRVPFGGVKRSGHGRELAAIGLREFTNTKTVLRGAAPMP